jgi:uncharacterized membrane protein YedE/YeeE
VNRTALAGLGGLVVASGLGIAGLTDATRVIGFLDFGGSWDPTALLVLAAATIVYGLVFRLGRFRRRPVGPSASWRAPPDRRLVAGATLFGIGWGATGLCPAPALTVAATGALPVLVFVAAMLAGMALFAWNGRRHTRAVAPTEGGVRCP